VVENLKELAKKILCPMAYLVNQAFVVENFLDCAVVAQPEELGAPEKFAILTDRPMRLVQPALPTNE
jgi:hypothetical protein